MSKLPNGMIVFMRDQVIPGPKMLDIEITNTFPLIALTEETRLVRLGQPPEILTGYDHVAMPPDFRLHLSSPKDHLFFDATPIWDALETGDNKPIHYFTIVGLPSDRALPLVAPGEARTWGPSMIVSPFKDEKYNSATRLFVDFFLHRMPADLDGMKQAPFAMNGMRFAGDQGGFLIGPHDFDSLQRRNKSDRREVAFTMRMGYANIEDNDSMYICTPLEIFQRRPR